MGERDRIARYFAPLAAGEPGSFALTDDAAALTPPSGQQLVITTDSVIQHIHVLADADPAHYAQKLVRRNLSDLAAMGATPWRYTLNLHTPPATPEGWFAAFAQMLQQEQEHFHMQLIGGDSTSGAGAIHTTMTCFGLLDHAPLRRNGARAGDDLYVSGTIGDAALALTMLQQNASPTATYAAHYHSPEPRLALGNALHGIATAAMDISDGLMRDMAQLCQASGVGVIVQRAAIPLSDTMRSHLQTDPTVWRLVFNGGDDYELCFTAPPAQRDALGQLAKELVLPLTRIGVVTAEKAVRLHDAQGASLPISGKGWEYA